MRVVKVRARPASLLPSRSRVVRSDVRGGMDVLLASGRVARAVDVVPVADRACHLPSPPLTLAARSRVALRFRRARLGRRVGDDAQPPRARSTPARGFRQRRERAPRPRLLLLARRLRQDGPLRRSPHRHLRWQALFRRLRSAPSSRTRWIGPPASTDSRRPARARPGPRPDRRPRATTPRGPIHPRPRPRAHARRPNPARGVRVGVREAAAKPPTPRDLDCIRHASRCRRAYRRGSRSRTELPARSSSRRSSGSSRVSRDRTTPRCPCFTATIVGSDPAPRAPICFWANRRTPGSWSSPSATRERRRRRKRRRRPGFDGDETRRRIPRLRSFDSRTVRGISRRRTPRARRSLRSVRLVRVVFAARAEADEPSPARRRAAAAFGSRATPRTAWRRDA